MPSGAEVPEGVTSEIVDYVCKGGGTAQMTDRIESDGFLEQFSELTGDAHFHIGKFEVSGNGFVYQLVAANGNPATFL